MVKKNYGKEDWIEFRNEILDLVSLYHQVKEFSAFDKNKIQFIESFFYLSKRNAITAFFIKVGFLISNGTPTFKDFLSEDTYSELFKIYDPKIKTLRDKYYAHNVKTHESLKNLNLANDDVEELYAKIISSAQEIDKKYEDAFVYDFVVNSDGIKSIESIIDDSNELDILKDALALSANNFRANVEMDMISSKIKIVEKN